MPEENTPRELGGGLILRWSGPKDIERIAALTSSVFRDAEDAPANADMAAYTRQLMSDTFPLMTAGDFAVVEETDTARIVACSCLLRQTWQFGGVPFPVGRPELVVTNPAYRRRGLIRAIFGALHARSDGRGDLAQSITGIPYFYRQFGYEYALELGGGSTAYFTDIPPAPPETQELFHLRPAGAGDVSFVTSLYEQSQTRSCISAVIPAEHWRSKILAPVVSDADWQVQIIVHAKGTPAGYVVLVPIRSQKNIEVRQVETTSDVGMRAVAMPVLRALRDLAPTLRTDRILDPPTGIYFALGSAHPWYDALGERLLPRRRPPYAWYVRIADLPRFLLHVRSVLEQRLAASVLPGFSGDLRLDFYRGGLRLVFAEGQLTQAEDWQPPSWGRRDSAAFPSLVFTQLLFGYRDLDALRTAYPDVRCSEEAEPLLRALFPPTHSHVLPLD